MIERMPMDSLSDEELMKRVEAIMEKARSDRGTSLTERETPRSVKIEDIPAFTADYRRGIGLPDQIPGQRRTPAELAALLQAQGERLDRLSRLAREHFPPDPNKVP